MGQTATTLIQGVYNRAVAWEIFDSPLRRRTAFVYVGNSNVYEDDNGDIARFTQVLASSGYAMFDLGVHNAIHPVGLDHGGDFYGRRAGEGSASIYGSGAGKPLKVFLPFQAAAWTEATKKITTTGGEFTGFDITAGTKVVICSGTNLTPGTYVAASRIGANDITLTASIGATASAVTGFVEHDLLPAYVLGLNRYPVCEPATAAGGALWLPASNQYHFQEGKSAGFVAVASPFIYRRNNPLPAGNRLIYSLLHALDDAGSPGSFNIRACYTASPSIASVSNIGSTKTVSTAGNDGDLAWATYGGPSGASDGFTVRADRTTSGVGGSRDSLCFALNANGAGEVGPFTPLYYHVTDYDATVGFSVTGMMAAGGMSRYDMAWVMQGNARIANASQIRATAKNHLRAVLHQFAAEVGGDESGMVVFVIRDNFNAMSTSESATSLGPSGAASNTPAGCTDNFKAIKSFLADQLADAINDEELNPANIIVRFIIIGEHRLSDSPVSGTPADYATNAKNEQWRRLQVASDAAYAATQDDTCVIDTGAAATFSELSDGGCLIDPTSTGGDLHANDRHLTPKGYQLLWGRMLSAINAFPSANAAVFGSLGGTSVRVPRGADPH